MIRRNPIHMIHLSKPLHPRFILLGLAVLAHVRGGVVWPLLALVVAVHIPILHVQGPHYMYWPAAFWGLFNASLVQWAWCRVKGRPM